jgi:curved DNA-binding protein CbpA
MRFFSDTLNVDELKAAYRRLVMVYHPDRGGDNEMMKRLNYEYSKRMKLMEEKPSCLEEIKVGNIVLVNESKCIVTEVNEKYFKAKSFNTQREAYFSKSTGFAMLNYRYRAKVQ